MCCTRHAYNFMSHVKQTCVYFLAHGIHTCTDVEGCSQGPQKKGPLGMHILKARVSLGAP